MPSVILHRDGMYRVIRTKPSPEKTFNVRRKIINRFGKVEQTDDFGPYPSIKLAEERVKTLSRMNVEKSGWTQINQKDAPEWIARHCEEDGEVVTPNVMHQYIHEILRQRCVVFGDNDGMESHFDVGVEYMAEDLGEPELLSVYDRYGEPRFCKTSRLCEIRESDDCVALKKRMAKNRELLKSRQASAIHSV